MLENEEILLKKIEALNKPYWFASDIANYLNCSMARANKVKGITSDYYGFIAEHKEQKEKAVKADDAIKVVGGVDRLTELNIITNTLNILKGI